MGKGVEERLTLLGKSGELCSSSGYASDLLWTSGELLISQRFLGSILSRNTIPIMRLFQVGAHKQLGFASLDPN